MLAIAFNALVKEGERVKSQERVEILEEDGIFKDMKGEIKVDEHHKEYVDRESIDLKIFSILAKSKSCEVEAIKHRKRPLYGVQFHIERSGEIGKRVIQNFYEYGVKGDG